MEDSLLIDTNILIDLFRGRKAAVDFLMSLDKKPAISTLTVAEIFAGVKGEKEMTVIDDFLNFSKIVPLDKDIARNSGLFKNQYLKGRGVGLADEIIAATATKIDSTLVTLKQRYFDHGLESISAYHAESGILIYHKLGSIPFPD